MLSTIAASLRSSRITSAPEARAVRTTAAASTTPRPSGRCGSLGSVGTTVVVQVDVRELVVGRRQKRVERAADRRVAGVEDQPELAEVEVAGRAEVRKADAGQVLDHDAHAELVLELLELGEGALQGVDDAGVAGDGAPLIVGVHDVGERPDLGGRLEVPAVKLHRVPPVAFAQAARLHVVVRSVHRQSQATLQRLAAIPCREQVVLVGRVDLRQRRASGDALQSGAQRETVPGVGGQTDVGREVHGESVLRRRVSPRGSAGAVGSVATAPARLGQ